MYIHLFWQTYIIYIDIWIVVCIIWDIHWILCQWYGKALIFWEVTCPHRRFLDSWYLQGWLWWSNYWPQRLMLRIPNKTKAKVTLAPICLKKAFVVIDCSQFVPNNFCFTPCSFSSILVPNTSMTCPGYMCLQKILVGLVQVRYDTSCFCWDGG